MILSIAKNLWCRCGAVPTLGPVKDEDEGEAGRCHHGGEQKDQLLHLVFASLFLPPLAFFTNCDFGWVFHNYVGHIPLSLLAFSLC